MVPRPQFYSQPYQFMRWASIRKPAIFWSVVLGTIGPIMMVVVPPVRHALGDNPKPLIPLTYPSTYKGDVYILEDPKLISTLQFPAVQENKLVAMMMSNIKMG